MGTTGAVEGTETTAVTAVAGGTDNNQLKGASEEMMRTEMTTATEAAIGTETATMTATMTMLMPSTAH